MSRILSLPLPGIGGASGLLVFLAFCILMLSSLNPGSVEGLRTSITDALAPALNVVAAPLQKTALFVRNVSGLAEMQSENARLLEENAKLREWYQTAMLLEAENKSLHELLNVKVEQRSSAITARILSDSSSTFARSLLVSAGTQDGIRKGQAVISGDGLVGRVVEAGERVSRVLLISDMNSRVPVLIENSRQHAIFAGNNGQEGLLVYLPADREVDVGARIVTSGQGGIFPAGLPVGVVSKVDGKRIEVQPFADFSRMIYVRVLDRPDDPNLHEGSMARNPT
ncbi:MAG: rod shape-determining protein MreC [Alphaproteobacteria bacterium]|nr:rod shape-determining protein MreC [Alphaproteobacteria bacterium]